MSNPILVGAKFIIGGTNFTAGSKVNFFVATSHGAVNAGPLSPSSEAPTRLTVAVPDTTSLGQGFVSVQVVNTDTGFAASNLAYALLQGYAGAGIATITSINSVPLAATSSDPSYATNNVETIIQQGKEVRIGGSAFDTVNGAAVDLFCACLPSGKIPTILLNPGNPGLTSTLLTFILPPASILPTGPGSFVVSNAGADKRYAKKSNAVSAVVGARIHVASVAQSGTTLTVNGSGFSTLTVVINFFNTQGGVVKNLGGNLHGKPAIALTIKSANQFTFSGPIGVQSGASYVQAVNPPFTPYTSSGNDPGGAFTLK